MPYSPTRSSRPLGGQSCCAIVLHTPACNCGIDCTKGHRYTADYNVGHFLKQLQGQFFDVHRRQYPVIMFHEDLKNTQRRMLRAKTKSALLFQKINLNPMALPINLRPRFAAIVNATKDAHRHGDLFRPERVGASFRGFQQRMLSRFYAGEMLLEHKSLLGYKYILRFDAIQVRITSAFSYDPFERAQVLKSVYNFHSTVVDSPVTVINPLLKKWLDTYEFAGKLMKPFVNRDAGEIHHNGRAYSQSAELFNLDAFKTTTYRTLFESADADCEFLLGDTHETSLTSGQFLGIAMPFVAAKTPGAVTYLDDLPIQHPIDLDDLYT